MVTAGEDGGEEGGARCSRAVVEPLSPEEDPVGKAASDS